MKIHTIDLEFEGLNRAIAAFLVESGETRILIETGPESTRETLLGKLKVLGCNPVELDAVFVTHIHLDHAGAAGWFANQGIPLYLHPKAERHLLDPTRLIASARMVYGDQFDNLWGDMTPAPAESVHAIPAGFIQTVGELSIEALETPGHAFHHYAFALGNTCFAGDAAGACITGSDFISVTSAPPQFDLAHTLNSIDLLKSRDFDILYLTHFGSVLSPKQHLSDYREAVELNAEFIRQRLEENMDPESLKVAYQAFCMEQAFGVETARETWDILQKVNSADMCAEGIRLFWENK